MSSRGWSKGTAYKKFLRINSTNRTLQSDPDTNFSVNLGTNLQLVSKISVLQCQFTNAFYNVFQTSQKYNNAFTMITTSPTLSYNLTIPPGYYSVYTLFAAIKKAVDGISGTTGTTITFNIDSTTNIVNAYVTTTKATVQFTHSDVKTNGLGGRQDNWPFGLLGFAGDFTISTSSGSPTLATYFPSLNNPSKVYVTSSALAPGNALDEDGKTSNILLPMDITVPFLGLQTWECKQDEQFEVNFGRPRNLGLVDIQLVDHDGDPLDLHGTVFNIDLQVFTNQF